MKIKKSLLKYVFPKASIETRLAVIRGDRELVPVDLVTVLYILTHDTSIEVSREAVRALRSCSESTVMTALSRGLAPEITRYIARSFSGSEKVLDMVALDDNVDDETLCALASGGPLSVIEILVEREKVLMKPGLLTALRSNPKATYDLINRAEELISTGGAGRMESDGGDISGAIPDVLTDDGFNELDSTSLYQMIQHMSVGDKVKLALTGNKEARSTLIKQSNKVVSKSVVRNPRITEDEIVKITQTRSVPDELLREIARNDEWLKSYPIKRGLVFNPKTPVQVTLRLLSKLNVKDLALLSKSKGVPGIVVAGARKIVDRKNN